MQSQWSDTEAQQMVSAHAARGINSAIALRVYSSRLLGRDPALVLHGGGNTSVKTVATDMLGDECEVLCVKGSGWDLATIEAAGLPAVRLQALRRLEQRTTLSDEDMVAFQRLNLLDVHAPNPSVETLLHAFLPHRYIDHTHASAILSLSNQADGEGLCREVFGDRVAYVPFIMPGFLLAKQAAEIFRQQPEVEGLLLHQHGIFTFGDTAQASYERMIALVDLAEQRLQRGTARLYPSAAMNEPLASVAEIAPIVRGACTPYDGEQRQPIVMEFRTSSQILDYVNGAELQRYSQQGVITPDHIIRTKNKPLIVPAPHANGVEHFAAAVEAAVNSYVEAYRNYFHQENAHASSPKTMLDPMPRVVLVPGVGLFGLGSNKQAAMIAADLAEASVQCITDAERIGHFSALPESALFEMEYWSLEQAKLGHKKPLPLAGNIAVITGAAGAIGAATARLFVSQGAHVVLLDRDREAVTALAAEYGAQAVAVVCDVCDADAVSAAFDVACCHFGGVDILVSNAGAAWQGAIAELDEAVLRQSFELNFFAHQRVAQHAVAIMRKQKTGGKPWAKLRCLWFT
jgi:rhamnose utilization protein RhaD (predicted bifunctional aldolase and dehydrogenase)